MVGFAVCAIWALRVDPTRGLAPKPPIWKIRMKKKQGLLPFSKTAGNSQENKNIQPTFKSKKLWNHRLEFVIFDFLLDTLSIFQAPCRKNAPKQLDESHEVTNNLARLASFKRISSFVKNYSTNFSETINVHDQNFTEAWIFPATMGFKSGVLKHQQVCQDGGCLS